MTVFLIIYYNQSLSIFLPVLRGDLPSHVSEISWNNFRIDASLLCSTCNVFTTKLSSHQFGDQRNQDKRLSNSRFWQWVLSSSLCLTYLWKKVSNGWWGVSEKTQISIYGALSCSIKVTSRNYSGWVWEDRDSYFRIVDGSLSCLQVAD